MLEKYAKLWDEIKYHIQTINAGKSGECEKDYMKIKFISDDDLPLNKILKFHNLTIIVTHFFEKDSKYYLQVFLNECLHEKSMNFNDVPISSIKRNDYRIHFWYMSKDDATNTMKNSNLEKSGSV